MKTVIMGNNKCKVCLPSKDQRDVATEFLE